MPLPNQPTSNDNGKNNNPYISRVLENDAMRKGLAAAAAGAVIALVTEALWPSES